jgi:hypothetical protein
MPQNRITIIPAIHGKLTMLLTFGYRTRHNAPVSSRLNRIQVTTGK